jgi:hypothetical protein
MSDQYTIENRTELEAYLATHSLPSGLGDKESACTLAAINLAITGKLTDVIPSCMSLVLGSATIRLQDGMPDQMRNSKRYKRLIPDMPGTGRERDTERLAVLMDWMWTVVLPQLQPLADKNGFGPEWRKMCEVKTSAAAEAARAAVYADEADVYAARAAVYVGAAVEAANVVVKFWEVVDPIGVLERMTYLGEGKSDGRLCV